MNIILKAIVAIAIPYFVIAGSNAYADKNTKQLIDAVDFFFETQKEDKNHIVSPLSKNRCASLYLVALTEQHKNDMIEILSKKEINFEYKKLSMKNKNTGLAGVDLILTRSKYGAASADKLEIIKENNILLGENILAPDITEQQKQQRENFNQHVNETLIKEFNGDLNLNYNSYLQAEHNEDIFLKIISTLRFNGAWKQEFNLIEDQQFTTNTNEIITIPFMSATIPDYSYYKSGWQIQRIFYKDKYAMDIILPNDQQQLTKNEQKDNIIELVSYINNYDLYNNTELTVKMPLFNFRQKNDITNYFTENMLPHTTMEHFGFFNDKIMPGTATVTQECIIKVDQKGTVAEAITAMAPTCCMGMPLPRKNFTVNKPFFFILSKTKFSIDLGGFIQDSIIMMGKIENPKITE